MADALPIYLDYGATTPCDPRVVDAMVPWLRNHFGNPASRTHAWGQEAEAAVERARGHVANLIGADPREIVWTSGATESINLALKGAAEFYQDQGKHLITLKTEHKATLDTMHELERRGFEVTFLDVQPDGLVDLASLAAAIRPDTTLVSVLLVNNEIGVVQDVAAIGALCHSHGVLLHVDAAQATGRVDIDLGQLPIDLMSMTAHKTYGPKGVGALYVRRKPRVRLVPQIHGGGHERGLRSGTLPTHQIVGMGEAFRLIKDEMAEVNAQARKLQQRLLDGLIDLGEVVVNGSLEHRVPQNLNMSFKYIEGEALMTGIHGVALSSGSACTSASMEPSYVLKALGRSDELAHSSLRMTIGRFTTEQEIDFAVEAIRSTVQRLRNLSPLWEMHQAGVDVDALAWDVAH
ncbi:MAG: IscS subfamily cysteine desulfurase [Comamonadaceae bacterium]|nr:IscS subfamily cysteine desulfurase [Burkholderiales bacterium]MEB2349441.1 IscS subfamily cysteine desulfurase [Comamonadaceae bacterium]